MVSSRRYKISFKEKLYFGLMLAVSSLLYICAIHVFFMYTTHFYICGSYALLVAVFMFVMHVFFIGHLKGNAIKLNQNQLHEVYEIVQMQSEKLGLKKSPSIWVLQGNGILNAFASRFIGRNYIVLYSDVLETAYKEGLPAIQFIIGHELGHIKRDHVGFVKSFFILPAKLIPFLGSAYSRACEYSCDMIGYDLCSEGAEKGISILAAGKELYKKINMIEVLAQAQKEKGFVMWFAEIFSSHPHLVKRIASLQELNRNNELENSVTVKGSRVANNEFDGARPETNDISKQPPLSSL